MRCYIEGCVSSDLVEYCDYLLCAVNFVLVSTIFQYELFSVTLHC